MQIVIDATEYSYGFCVYLAKVAGRRVIYQLNSAKLIMWDKYFEEELNKKVNTASIIVKGASSLTVVRKTETFEVQIDPYKYLQNFNRTLESVCKEVNFGNMQVMPYPIFTDVFGEIQKNLKTYYKKYLVGAVM